MEIIKFSWFVDTTCGMIPVESNGDIRDIYGYSTAVNVVSPQPHSSSSNWNDIIPSRNWKGMPSFMNSNGGWFMTDLRLQGSSCEGVFKCFMRPHPWPLPDVNGIPTMAAPWKPSVLVTLSCYIMLVHVILDHSWQNIVQAKWMISSNKEQTSLDPDPALQASNACKRNCCQRLSSKLPRPKSCPTTRWPDTPTWPVTLSPQHASWTWIRNHQNWRNWLSSSSVIYSFIHLSTIFHPWAPWLWECPSFFAPNDQHRSA